MMKGNIKMKIEMEVEMENRMGILIRSRIRKKTYDIFSLKNYR